MLSPSHGQTHAKENDAEFATLHPLSQVNERLDGDAADLIHVKFLPFQDGPECLEAFIIPVRLYLEEDVCVLSGASAAHVHHYDCSVLAALDETAFHGSGISREMPVVCLDGVASPEDYQISPVFDCS